MVVLAEPGTNLVPSLRAGLQGMQVYTFIFQAPPQPFHKHVIHPPALPIHGNLDPVVLQDRGKFTRRKLRALIRIEYVRHAIQGQRLLQRFQAEMRIHRIGQAPGEHFATLPIHNRHQI